MNLKTAGRPQCVCAERRRAERSPAAHTTPQATSPQPAKRITENRTLFERPGRTSRARPQTQVIFLPPDLVWAGRASLNDLFLGRDRLHVLVSDSLVDNRGCLNHRTECETLAGHINL